MYLNRHQRTAAVCPVNVRSVAPVWMFQSFSVLSCDALTSRRRPGGEQSQQSTGPLWFARIFKISRVARLLAGQRQDITYV